MSRILAALAVVVALVTGAVVYDTADPEPAVAADNLFGIHAGRATSYQSGFCIQTAIINSASWETAFGNAVALWSNASARILGRAYQLCTFGTAIGVNKQAQGLDGYPIHWDFGLQDVNHLRPICCYNLITINTSYSGGDSWKAYQACDAVGRALGVGYGCALNGWPTQEGINIMNANHNHQNAGYPPGFIQGAV